MARPVPRRRLGNPIHGRKAFYPPRAICRIRPIAEPARRGGRCGGNLPQARIPLAIELAASRMASMTATEVRGSSRSAVSAPGRITPRPVTPPNTASRGGLVLRPPR
jgi:hypothetical protein